MRKMRELDGSNVYIGTAREIRTLLKKLTVENGYYPLYTDEPKFNSDRMYAVETELQDDLTYTWVILNADTIVRLLVAGVLVEDYFKMEEL